MSTPFLLIGSLAELETLYVVKGVGRDDLFDKFVKDNDKRYQNEAKLSTPFMTDDDYLVPAEHPSKLLFHRCVGVAIPLFSKYARHPPYVKRAFLREFMKSFTRIYPGLGAKKFINSQQFVNWWTSPPDMQIASPDFRQVYAEDVVSRAPLPTIRSPPKPLPPPEVGGPARSYAGVVGVHEPNIPVPGDVPVTQWQTIHRAVAERSPVLTHESEHGVRKERDFIRFVKSVHLPIPDIIPDAKQKSIRRAIAEWNKINQRKQKKYALIVSFGYDFICRNRSNKKAQSLCAMLVPTATVFVTLMSYDKISESFHLGDYFPCDRFIKTPAGVFSDNIEVFNHVVKMFMDERDKNWCRLLCGFMRLDFVTPEQFGVLLRVLNAGIKNSFVKGSWFSVKFPTANWRITSAGVFPNAMLAEQIRQERYSALTTFDSIMLSVVQPIMSMIVHSEAFEASKGQPVETRRFEGIADVVPEFPAEIQREFPAVASIVSLLVLSTEVTSLKGWVAMAVLLTGSLKDYNFTDKWAGYFAYRFKGLQHRCASDKRVLEAAPDFRVLLTGEGSSWREAFEKFMYGPHCANFFGTELGSALWDVLCSFSIVGLFAASGMVATPTTVRNWMQEFNRLLKPVGGPNGTSPVESFTERFFRFLTIASDRFLAAIREKDWTKLFVDDLTVSKWSHWVDTLIETHAIRFDPGRPGMDAVFKSSKDLGLIPPQITRQLTNAERLAMLGQTAGHVPELKARYARDSLSLQIIKVKVDAIRNEERALVAMEGNSSFRIVPWGIFVHGDPGCGKTTLCSRIHHALAEKLGFVGNETTMYRIDPMSNFHDTFHNGQWAVFLDDIDQSVAPESASVMNHATLVNKLINSAPFCLESAAIDDKGEMFANFLACYYTTNFAGANLKGRSSEPMQFWRRFPLRVHMKVKPDYVNEAGGLGKNAYHENGDIKSNVWNYEVQLFTPTAESRTDVFTNFPYGPVRLFDNDVEFFGAVVAHFEAFYQKEKKRFADRKSEEKVLTRCPICCQSIDNHSNRTACTSVVKLEGRSDPVEVIFWMFIYLCVWNVMGTIAREAYRVLLTLPAEWFEILQLYMYRKMVARVGYFTFAGYWCSKHLSPRMYSLLQREEVRNGASFFLRHKEKFAILAFFVKVGIPMIMDRLKSKRELMQLQGVGPSNPTGLPKRKDVWAFADPKLWDRPYAVRSKPTYTLQELGAVLRKRLVKIRGPGGRMFGVALGHGVLVFPKHILTEDERVRDMVVLDVGAYIYVSVGNAEVKVFLHPSTTTLVQGRDVIVAYVPEVIVAKDKWDVLKDIPPTCLALSGSRCDQAFLVRESGLVPFGSRIVGTPGYMLSDGHYCWEGVFDSEPGDCGSPLVASFGDRFYFLGFHGVGRKVSYPVGETKFSRCESFAMDELSAAFAKIRAVQPNSLELTFDPKLVEPLAEELRFQGLVTKSSLRVSLAFKQLPVEVLGTYTGPTRFGTTLATKVHLSGLYHPWIAAELRKMFVDGDGFSPPYFRGVMKEVVVDEEKVLRWCDPHTRSLETGKNLGGHLEIWRRCRQDYLSGMDDLPGSTGIVPLSDWAVIAGVSGSTVGPFNLQTSAGAPFFRNKRVCVAVDHNLDPPTVQLSKELRDGIDRIVGVVSDGGVYSPLSVHCLKDEAVSVVKNDNQKVRVFNIMPFALNFLLKKYLSPIVAFMREHCFFFECAVGTNIAGVADSRRAFAFLTTWPLLVASDAADYDTTASTLENLEADEVFVDIARFLGYTPLELRITRGLLMSCNYVTHCSHGDFWVSSYGLPSGAWITLIKNCVRNSLQSRYAYFARRGLCLPSFRSVVHLLVLGDDNIACVDPVISWYNQVYVAEVLKEIGCVRTSSVKGRDLVPFETFETATFLKRMFVRMDGLVVCPIEKKTLMRMLVIVRKTTLSQHDHRCVTLSTVLAEAWMWGREYFEEVRQVCADLARDYDLSGRELRLDNFDDYVARYKSGKLVVWDPLADHVPEEVDF